MGSTEASIPTIDISPYLAVDATAEAQEDVVTEIRDACTTYGFFQLIGHGIPREDQDEILGCAQKFFDLPMEDKQEVWIEKAMGRSNRGYEMYRGQSSQPGLLPDMKEGFVVGAEIPKDDPDAGRFLTGPNQWPKALPAGEFEERIMSYRAKLLDLSEKVLHILAQGLPKEWGCDANVFDEFMIKPSGNIRLLHYPPQTTKDPRQLGAGAHTDFGGITFLLQQPGTKGLEVWYPPSESWIPVPVQEDSFVVNIGDLVSKWTAGFYRSAIHRVINFGEKHRYSAPFFLNGNMKMKLHALDGSGLEVGVEEHFLMRLRKSLGKEKSRFLDEKKAAAGVVQEPLPGTTAAPVA